VLPTGECIHTGFDRFENTPLGPLHRWGVGPALDGLFSQSPFGIVTRMTFWLSPLPKSLHVVRFELSKTERLGPTVDAIRRLRMDGTIRSSVGIWNDYRAISTERQYPWDLTSGQTPLSRAHLEALKGSGGAEWYGVTALYAPTPEQGRASALHVERTLSSVVDALFVHESNDAHDARSAEDPALLFFRGIPHEASLRSVYWRKKGPIPDRLDPDRDRCGVLWVCPTLPLRGTDVLVATRFAETLLVEHGFEPLLAMIAQTERTMYLVPLLIYDRDVPGADDRALACHDALLDGFKTRGYLPHRLGIRSTNALPASRDDYVALMSRLKAVLDPNGVLAPGRYGID
jgi:4-cresol dehydrogenase (hydroxylating)